MSFFFFHAGIKPWLKVRAARVDFLRTLAQTTLPHRDPVSGSVWLWVTHGLYCFGCSCRLAAMRVPLAKEMFNLNETDPVQKVNGPQHHCSNAGVCYSLFYPEWGPRETCGVGVDIMGHSAQGHLQVQRQILRFRTQNLFGLGSHTPWRKTHTPHFEVTSSRLND